MPANPTSVQEAREALEHSRYKANRFPFNRDLDALIAAVRAERDAEIRGMVEGMRKASEDKKAYHDAAYMQQQCEQAAFDAVLALLSDREGAK